jgi:tripartite ATP-independent transporter DctM subunit
MSDPLIAVIMLGIFVLTILLGFPICFTLMAMGVAFGYYAYYDAERMQSIFDNQIFDLLVNQTYSVMANDVLTAVPLFLFMGYIVERANIVDRLFFSMQIAARRLPGSMAIAALGTCALFATATGIIGAVVTLMGLLAFPSMLKARYDVSFAAGVICAGGCLGILIPPSIMLIVYSATSNVSVVRLYAGAIFPGFMLAGLYIIYVMGRAMWNPKLAPKPKAEDVGDLSYGRVIIMMMTSFFPLAFLILSVLGAILFGLATPSEAASMGALGGLVLAAAYRALTWERLKESVYLTVRTSAMVCWLFVGSWTFASVFSYLGGHALIEETVLGMGLTPVMFLIMAQFIIFVPIFLPMLPAFGVDPLFFGILVAMNLQTSFLTPPMAMAAYYLKGVAPPHVRLIDIVKGVLPFLSVVILAMVLLYIFPKIITYLPDLVYGKSR